MAIHVCVYTTEGIRELLPGQPRQHPGVGAQGIAVEASGASRLQPFEIAGLGFLDASGEVDGAAAGAVGEFQQGPAVVGQLEAVP